MNRTGDWRSAYCEPRKFSTAAWWKKHRAKEARERQRRELYRRRDRLEERRKETIAYSHFLHYLAVGNLGEAEEYINWLERMSPLTIRELNKTALLKKNLCEHGELALPVPVSRKAQTDTRAVVGIMLVAFFLTVVFTIGATQ